MMLSISTILLLVSGAGAGAGAHAGAPREDVVVISSTSTGDIHNIINNDVTQKYHPSSHRRKRRAQAASIAGPSGSVNTNNPDVYVNQGSSGTIVAANPNARVLVTSPVQLTFTGVPYGYRIQPSTREQLVGLASQILATDLDPAYELVTLEYAGILPCKVTVVDSVNNINGGIDSWNGWNDGGGRRVQNNNNYNVGANRNRRSLPRENNDDGDDNQNSNINVEQNGIDDRNDHLVNENERRDQVSNALWQQQQNDWLAQQAAYQQQQIAIQNQNQQQQLPAPQVINNVKEITPIPIGACGCLGGSGGTNVISIALTVTTNAQSHIASSAASYIAQTLQSAQTPFVSNLLLEGYGSYNSLGQYIAYPSPMMLVGPYEPTCVVDSTGEPTPMPTPMPTPRATNYPTKEPTPLPTMEPTPMPTVSPTKIPTQEPTPMPTMEPTPMPSVRPTPTTPEPTPLPTPEPNVAPTTAEPTPLPTPLPTAEPTLPTPEPTEPDEEVVKELPLQFNLDDLTGPDGQSGYTPSPEDQEAILDMIRQMVMDNMGPGVNVEDVAFATGRRRKLESALGESATTGTRRKLQDDLQNSLYLPVVIKVKAPSSAVDDAYPELLDLAENNIDELVDNLKEYDYETFKDVAASTEASDVPGSDSAITSLPVHFFFNNVVEGYKLSKDDREDLVQYSKELLRENINVEDSGYELLQLAYASRFEFDEEEESIPTLPVRATLRGPKDGNEEVALSFILNAFEDLEKELTKHLKSKVGGGMFNKVALTFESHDLPDITVPSFVTDHPALMVINNVSEGYRLTNEVRTSIVSYVKMLVKENLADFDKSLELIEVIYEGELKEQAERTISVPLRVTVRGPSAAAEKTTQYVEQIILKYDWYLKDFLVSLDKEAFEDAILDVDIREYDWDEIVHVNVGDNIVIIDAIEDKVCMNETVHHLKLKFINAPDKFRLSSDDRASVLQFVEELFDTYLEDPLELIQIVEITEHSGRLSLALRITISVPCDSFFSLAYIMEILEEHERQLTMFMKSLDWDSFKAVSIGMETYDPEIKLIQQYITPVKLLFKNVDAKYHLTAAYREQLIRFVKELLEENLGDSFELIEIEHAGNAGYVDNLDSQSSSLISALPLHVVVKGPAEESNLALYYVMGALEEHKQEIVKFLKTLSWDTYKEVDLSIGTYAYSSNLGILQGIEETVHHVKLNCDNVQGGYHLSQNDKRSMIRFLRELLKNNIDDPFELVEFADEVSVRQTSDSFSLGLRIVVNGPADESEFALSYIYEVLENHNQDIEIFLESLSRDALKNVILSFDTYDPNAILPISMEETTHHVKLNCYSDKGTLRLSRKDKASIIRYVKDLLKDGLSDSFELVEMDDATSDNYASQFSLSNGTPRSDKISIPLRIVVNGPVGDSDIALSHIMDVLGDLEQDIESFLEKSDKTAFEDVLATFESYDPDAVETKRERTTHPIRINFDDVPAGYFLSDSDRSSTMRFVKDILKDNLNDPFELVEVADADSNFNQNLRPMPSSNSIRTDTVTAAMHILISVNGPAEDSDTALIYIMDALRENKQELMKKMKALSWNTYVEAKVRFDTFNPDAVVTVHPVRVNLEELPAEYDLSDSDSISIIRFVKDILNDNLNFPFELVEVIDGASGFNRNLQTSPSINSRRLDTATTALPLLISVSGPAKDSDIALTYVMDALRENKQELMKKLKALSWNTYVEANVRFDIYDPNAVVQMQKTIHPIRMNFGNVPAGPRLTRASKSSIIRFVKDLLDDNIVASFQLIEVADGASDRRRNLLSDLSKNARRPGSLSLAEAADTATNSDRHLISSLSSNSRLPLLITVRGPTENSDRALSYIMEALEDHKQDLVRKLKTLDWNTYNDVDLSFETYDPNEIERETIHPIRINFDDVPAGYRLSQEDSASILRSVNDLLDGNLNDALKLVEVAYARSNDAKSSSNDAKSNSKGSLSRNDNSSSNDNETSDGNRNIDDNENLDSLSKVHNKNGRHLLSPQQLERSLLSSSSQHPRRLALFLGITVAAPEDVAGFALPYIIEVLSENKQDIVKNLKPLKDVEVSIGTYDPNAPMEETEVPFRLNLENLPSGYQFSPDLLTSMLLFLEELSDAELNEPLDFVKVAYAGSWNGQRLLASRHLDTDTTVSLPLHITVEGHSYQSEFALPEVMNCFEDNNQEIVEYVEALDSKFENVSVSTELYDLSAMQETIHPVQLVLENTRPDHEFSLNERASVIQYVKERIDDSLVKALELMDVSYAGRLRSDEARMLLDEVHGHSKGISSVKEVSDQLAGPRLLQAEAPSIPLLIQVRGRADVSDFALIYIIQSIRDNIQDIEAYLKSLNDDAFNNTTVLVKTFDIDDIMQESNDPPSTVVKNDLLVWLLIGLGSLLFIICCCCICFCCICRQKKLKTASQQTDYSMSKTSHSMSDCGDALVTFEQPNTAVYPYSLDPQQIVLPMPPILSTTDSSSSDSSDDHNMIFINDTGTLAAQSALTFHMDPPSAHHPKLARGTFDVRQELAPSVASGNVYEGEYDDDHISFGSSVVPSHAYQDPNAIHGGNTILPIDADKPIGLNEQGTAQSYSTQPPSARSVASVRSNNLNIVVPYCDPDSQSQSIREEPPQMYHFDGEESYTTQAPEIQSYSTQPPEIPSSHQSQSHFVQEPGELHQFNDQNSYSTQSQLYSGYQEPAGVCYDSSSVATKPLASGSFATLPPRRQSSVGSVLPGNLKSEYSRTSMPHPQHDEVNGRDDSSDFYLGTTRPSKGNSFRSAVSSVTRGRRKKKYNRMSSMPHLQLDDVSTPDDSSNLYLGITQPSGRNSHRSGSSSVNQRKLKKKQIRRSTPHLENDELIRPGDSGDIYHGQPQSFYV